MTALLTENPADCFHRAASIKRRPDVMVFSIPSDFKSHFPGSGQVHVSTMLTAPGPGLRLGLPSTLGQTGTGPLLYFAYAFFLVFFFMRCNYFFFFFLKLWYFLTH